MRQISTWLLAALVCVAGAQAHAQEDATTPDLCIPSGAETATIGLIADPGYGKVIDDADGAMAFETISIDKNIATFVLARLATAEGIDSVPLARVVVLPLGDAAPDDTKTANFAIRSQILHKSAGVTAAVDKAIASIRANDDGSYYQSCATTPRVHREVAGAEGAEADGSSRFPTVIAALALLLAAALANFLSGRKSANAPDSKDE